MKRLSETGWFAPTLCFAVIAVIVSVVFLNPRSSSRPKPSGIAPKTVYSAVATPYAGTLLFGLQDVHALVHSAYAYEAGMLGSYPVDDLDYQLPYAAQELVTLPGFSSDYYTFLGASYLDGSGYVSCWIIQANGGHFCLLHLSVVNTPSAVAPAYLPKARLSADGRALSGDEQTALAIGMMSKPPLPTATRFSGNFVIGRSGWPSSFQYSNYSCGSYYTCQGDAHLCLVLDQRAADWFLLIVTGQHLPPKPKPKPFNISLWNAYRHGHHLSLISPYDKHHHLVWAASVWTHHMSLRGVKARGRWYPARKKGGYGYTKTAFSRGCIYTFPRARSSKVGKC